MSNTAGTAIAVLAALGVAAAAQHRQAQLAPQAEGPSSGCLPRLGRGAVERAYVPGAQFVNLLSALQGGGGPLALLRGRAPRPAGRVRRDFLRCGVVLLSIRHTVPRGACGRRPRCGQRVAGHFYPPL